LDKQTIKFDFDPTNIRILIVEDQEPMRKAIRRILNRLKFEDIEEVNDGVQAVELLNKKPFDCVILDIYLKIKHGFEVLEMIRNHPIRSDMPVLVLSGEANRDDIVRIFDLGANDYLLKPFQSEDLEKKVLQVLTNFLCPHPLLKKLREGEKLLFSQNYLEAKQTFQSVLLLQKNHKKAQYFLALTDFYMGNIHESIVKFKKNLQAEEPFYQNYAALADIYMEQKKTPLAINYLDKELCCNPKQNYRQVVYANLLLKSQQFEKAIEHYRLVLRHEPKYSSALMGAGKAFAQQKDLEKALYYFKRHRRTYPEQIQSLNLIVQCCLKFKNPKKAEQTLKEEISRYPRRLDTYIILAKFYYQRDQDKEAMQILNKLYRYNPRSIAALELQAQVAFYRKNFEDAAKFYELILKRRKNTKNIHFLIKCYLKIKKYKKAKILLERLLSIQENRVQTLLLLGQFFHQSRQYGKAFFLYKKISIIHKKQSRQEVLTNIKGQFLNRRHLVSRGI